MSPHKRCQAARNDLTQAVQKIHLENGLAEGDRAILTQAADAVVAELRAVSLQTSQESALQMDEAICAAPLNFGSSTAVGEELMPLKTQLQYVQDVLQVYAHTTLSFCSHPIEDEAAVLCALNEILVKPVVKHVKEVTKAMCERIEDDIPFFQQLVSGKGVEDKEIYENIFKKYTGESTSQEQRDAYKSVLDQIDEMKETLNMTGRAENAQHISDLLPLAIRFRACSKQFAELVGIFAGGTTTTTLTETNAGATTTTYVETSKLFPEVTIKQREGFKALYRIIEKGILKGPILDVLEATGRKKRDWEEALAAETVDCSKVLDGIGCIFLCGSFVSMAALVKRMIEVVATMDDVHFCRIKNRWIHPTPGGWMDLMFNLVVKGVVVEVQVAHKELYFARKQWGHSTYGDVRCFQELLAFTGNEAKESVTKDEPVYDVIFSHKTDQLPLVEEMIARMPGLRCFCQNDLDQTQNSWKLEWYKAYKTAIVCVCVLTKEYLLSGPCCLEWNTAMDDIGKRVVLAVDSPEDIVGHVDHGDSLCDPNIDVYLHLRNGSPVLLVSGKTVPELCAAIKKKLPQSITRTTPLRRVSKSTHTLGTAAAATAPSSEPSVDILVIVDYPTHGGGGGAIEPAKYIAPLQALEAAMDARFVGTQARIRFHTPQSIVNRDLSLLQERIPCLCWIALGEEAPAVDASLFTSSLWADHGGGCNFAITVMKHGAESIAEKMMDNGCAERVLWIAADYTAPSTNGFLANGQSKTAVIPDVLFAALTGAAFDSNRAGKVCCGPILALALKRSAPAGIRMKDGCSRIPHILKGEKRPQDDASISLSRTLSEPTRLTNKMVGVPHHSSVDLNQWSATCTMLQQLNQNRDGVHIIVVASGTEDERKLVAWTAIQSYSAVADRFDLIVYRDADVPASARKNPSMFDLPFDTHGDQDVLVWMDSRSEFPLEALREAIDAYVDEDGLQLPWTFIVTAADGLDHNDVADEFESASTVTLPQAIGTTVNESSEDFIRLVPFNSTLEVRNILDVIDTSQLLDLIAVALPQTDADGRGVRDYFNQILISDNNSIIVRGMVPNTKFLFELRNDLIDGSLERRINELLLDYVNKSVLGSQTWTLDKAAFASIYQHALFQMDQLSPHQREKLQECESTRRVHVTGPAGCGKTFIALHMVVDMIKCAEQSVGGVLSKESPILFVAKNEALCLFFVNWIKERLRKTHRLKEAKRLLSTYLRVLHTCPFGGNVFGLTFASSNRITFVPERGSENYSLIIVDEAHHMFAAAGNAEDCAQITELCKNASKSILLSDISQGETSGAVIFPPDHKDVLLTEVVRNSSRILTASLPFCRRNNLEDVTCNHGVRGPPLEPIVFDNCRDDADARYKNYVQGIVDGLQHMNKSFPGAEIHDNLVILVPNVEFKDAVHPLLTQEMAERGILMVDAVEGAFAESKEDDREPSRIVLDTLESFDGMERLYVFAVGLDSVNGTAGCCSIYRALTRAHMFVCVVQEHLPGGWLEFTAAVQRDESTEFDEENERKRVTRNNVAVIASLGAAAARRKDRGGGAPSVAHGASVVTPGDAKIGEEKEIVDYESVLDEGAEVEVVSDEFLDDEAEAVPLVITQNVWNLNLNAASFSETICSLSFTPMSTDAERRYISECAVLQMSQFSVATDSPFDVAHALETRASIRTISLQDAFLTKTLPTLLFATTPIITAATAEAAARAVASRYQLMMEAQPALPQPDTAPLSERLSSLKDVLNVCLQFELSAPSPSILTTVDFSSHMAVYVDPAIVIIKQELEAVKAQVAADPDKYRQMIADISNADRQIYDAVFRKSIHKKGAAYATMLQELVALQTSGRGMVVVYAQPTSDLIPLVLMVRANIPQFKSVVKAVVAQAFPASASTAPVAVNIAATTSDADKVDEASAALMAQLALSFADIKVYTQLWNLVDPDVTGYVVAKDAVMFFKMSGLTVRMLRAIWEESDKEPPLGKLCKAEFFVAVKLIALRQSKVQPIRANILNKTGLPKFEGLADGLCAPATTSAKVTFRSETQAPYRIIEQSLTSGPNPDYPDVSTVWDVFGCLISCADFVEMAAVVQAFADKHNAGELDMTRVTDRFHAPSSAGWRDLMLNVVINGVVFEVQIVQRHLLVARSSLDGHKAYNQFRSLCEIFDMLNLDPSMG